MSLNLNSVGNKNKKGINSPGTDGFQISADVQAVVDELDPSLKQCIKKLQSWYLAGLSDLEIGILLETPAPFVHYILDDFVRAGLLPRQRRIL